jgi:cleavage and polyadenylation specificity factor subunit 1
MFDEETGAEPKIISASIADPYILLIRDDSSIYVAQCDSDNELEELEREDDTFLTVEWLSGCLYTDRAGVFANLQTDKGVKDGENIIMFLLSAAGALHVMSLSSSNTVMLT